MKKQLITLLATLLMSGLFINIGYATTIYYDEDLFLNDGISLSLESFETLPVDNVSSQHNALDLEDFSIFTSSARLSVNNQNQFGQYATDGSNYLRNTNGHCLAFSFEQSQTSFGLNIIDWGDFGNGSLNLFLGNDSEIRHYQIASGMRGNGNQIFYGIRSDFEFQNALLFQTISGESWAIDGVYYGNNNSAPVPEPATMLLIGSGLLGMGIIKKKRVS